MRRAFFRKSTALLVVLVTIVLSSTNQAFAQDDGDAQRERQIAERFVEVLLRRPRPGTALDRVYSYHVQAGTLDEWIASLETDKGDGAEPGSRAMLRGLVLLRRGSDAEAAKALADAETVRDEDAMVSFYLGKALLNVGRTDAAAEALQRAIDRGPARNEALPVFTELGRLYQRAQQRDKALAVWNRLEAVFPGDGRVGEQIASILADEGQIEAALERYERLAREAGPADDTRTIGYQIAAAEMRRRLGQTEQALEDLESIAGRLRPASWLYSDVRRRIEAVFLRSGDYSALADYYARQVEQRPDEIALRLRHGQTLAKAGRVDEAEKALAESIRLAPGDTDARLGMIDVLKSAGKSEQVVEQWEQLAEQDPENPDYLVQLGNSWLETTTADQAARRERAAAVWQRLAEAKRDDAVVTAQVADLMRRIEHHDAAIELYRRAIELAPDQPQYREYLGEFLHRLDRHDEAVEVWAAIAEPPRDSRDNLIRLAEVFHTFDEPERGLEVFLQAAQLDPTFPQRLRLAELLARAERFDEALAQLDQADGVADSPEQREQVFQARVSVYGSSGTLQDRIAEAREQAAASGLAEEHRRLALMLDASGSLAEATAAIRDALQADENDIAALTVAAELYRKGSRLGDAVEAFRQLARRDTRFLPNYLKRISGLQLQLGQTDAALATAAELIEAQPGNPDSYRFYADQCFKVGRDDEGLETLRRALQAAPRDPDTRQALAAALANRFRTAEAIELYWDLLEDATSLNEEKRLVGLLAGLYDQQGDFDHLVSRLELRGREASDTRTATLLISVAHSSVRDFGTARQTLEPLLVDSPRDPELLGEIVNLAGAASEPEVALGYQQQLVAVADTPDNRSRLLKLMVDSGQIQQAEASLQRLQGMDDPVAMIDLIDRTFSRGDTEAAIRFARAVLERQPDLWEVRIRLAAYLMAADEVDEAVAQAAEVEALQLDASTPSRNRQALLASRGANAAAIQAAASSRLNQAQQAYRLASLLRLGRYSTGRYGISSQGRDVVNATDFGQARFLALALRLAAAAKADKLDEVEEPLSDVSELAAIEDPEQLWDFVAIRAIKEAFSSQQTTSGSLVYYQSQQLMVNVLWRLAEIDESERGTLIMQQLSMRQQLRNPPPQLAQETAALEPLSEQQLALVQEAYDSARQSANTSGAMAAMVHQELVAAGKIERAEALGEAFRSPDRPAAAAGSLRFSTASRALDSIPALLEGVAQSLSDWAFTMPAAERANLRSAVAAVLTVGELPFEAKLVAVDLAIALQAIDQSSSPPRRSSSPSQGTANVYYQDGSGYQSSELSVPFSERLLSSSFVQQLYGGIRLSEDSPERQQLLRHLDGADGLFADDSPLVGEEQKLRATLAAFARWWAADLPGAFDRIIVATERYPDDHDLWIERARMAAELNRPEAALHALDAIEPMDQATLRVRELAAMNLAAQLGRLERARTAAQRLFGMRLDASTEMALADQLTRLGMHTMASAVLQRTQRRGGQSPTVLLQLAQQFLDAGNKEAAAEVAYQSLRQSGGPAASNSSYYRQQAVRLLQRAGRLDKLLQQAERRVAASPQSLMLKSELAELYTAAGRSDDADRLFEQIAELQPADPKSLWDTATRLSRAGKHEEAVDKFLAAIEKQPELLEREFYIFQQAVSSSNQSDKAYRSLMQVPIDRIPSHYIGQLAQLYRRGSAEPSEAAQAFIDHILSNAPVEALGTVLRSIGRDPQIHRTEAIAKAVRRIFEADLVYLHGSPFWQGYGISSNGELYGPLQPCIGALQANKELATEVREQWLQRVKTDDEAARLLVNLLLLALDATTPEQQSTATEDLESRLRELITTDTKLLSQNMWWELGQVLQDQQGLEHLAVMALEHAEDDYVSSYTRQYEFSVHARLTNAYVAAGQKEKARRALLKGYQQTDNSEQNRGNPGYGDYSDLRSYAAITEKLVQVDGRLEAIRIYSDALADPERFERAKRWGGSNEFRSSFQQGLDTTLESLDEADLERFLAFQDSAATTGEQADAEAATGVGNDDTAAGQRFDLMPLVATAETQPERTSLAALVVTRLAESESGRERLAGFEQELAEQVEVHPRDWSLVAMQAMVGIALETDVAGEAISRLAESLPADPAEVSESEIPLTLALYSPAILALASERAAVRSAAAPLVDKVVAVAQRAERSEIARTLLMAKARTIGANDPAAAVTPLREMLGALVPAAETPRVLSTEVARECLQLAEAAATAGAWEVTGEALQRALAAGPPLRKLETTSTGSAFVIPTQRRTVGSVDQPQEDLDWIPRRVASIVALAQDAMSSATEDAPSAAGEVLFEALRDAVLPEQRRDEAFPYPVMLLTGSSTNRYPEPEMQPLSLSKLLADLAVATGRAEELRERLSARQAESKTPYRFDLVGVHLAIAEDDPAAADQALRSLANGLGVDIAGADSPPLPAVALNRSQQGSDEVVTNDLLHAVLPIHKRWGLEPAVAALEIHLLSEARRVKSVSDAGEIWGWMVRQIVADPRVDDRLAQQAIDHYLASVQLHYSNYSGSYGSDRQNAEMAELGTRVLASKRWSIAGRMLRQAVNREPGFQEGRATVAQLGLALVGVDAQQRYRLLSEIVFGEADDPDQEAATSQGDQTLLSASNMLLYADPPPALQASFAGHADPSQVPVAGKDLPIVELNVLLVEAAAESGQTTPLIARLEPRIEHPGDEIEAMIGLAQLINGEHEAALERLKRVRDRLLQTAPKGMVDTPLPINSATFATRALAVDQLRATATEAWQPMWTHAQFRYLGVAAALFNRMAVVTGASDMSGTAEGSPLKHFISVQTPYGLKPVSTMTEPLYAMEEGILRYAAGSGHNILMLKYPLEGDYTFTHRNLHGFRGESHTYFGGVAYMPKPEGSAATVRGLVSRGQVEFKNLPLARNQEITQALSLTDDRITMTIDGNAAVEDRRSASAPFVGVVFEHHTVVSTTGYALAGNPRVARHVNLIDADLRGWTANITGGSIPAIDLPIPPDQDIDQVRAQRQRNAENHHRFAWYSRDGQLLSGSGNSQPDAAGQRHIQYHRPLLDGESIDYRFQYDAGSLEVHPAIGRVVILLRPEGIKLRWLSQAHSLESFELPPLHEVDPDELIGSGKPKLRQGDWNEVKLTAEGDQVVVEVNGEAVCRVGLGLDRRFGLVSEAERECQVQEIRLTGPWPETLPDDLMERR